MNTGKTIFSQVMEFLPLHEFRKCVKRYQGDYKVKSFSCLDQFLCMAFAQLTYRESLRDIESCLRSMQSKLYHMGIRSQVSRNTLANANNTRDWHIYADFAQILIHIARELYLKEDFGVELQNTVYALDATTIDLCLSIFPWAKFRTTKAAVKLHTLLDLRGSIPSFVEITHGKISDIKILDILIPEPGSFYVMDRGYLDFERLHVIHQALAYFVIRAKKRLHCRPDILPSCGQDHRITLRPNDCYHRPQRRPSLSRKTPAYRLLRCRNRQTVRVFNQQFFVEPFGYRSALQTTLEDRTLFQMDQTTLKNQGFLRTSENAVKTQIWIAISVYVLVAIIKKRLKTSMSLYTILQILSVTSFEKNVFISSTYGNQLQKYK